MADEKSMMPELTLDPSRTDAVPQLTLDPAAPAAPAPEAAKPEATPVRLDENLLNDAEKQAVEAFSKKIDLTDSNLILQYGAAAQKNVASFSENALNSVRTKDLGEVGKSLSELVVELKGFGEEEEKKGLFGLFKKTGSKLEAMKAQYVTENTVSVDFVEEVTVDYVSASDVLMSTSELQAALEALAAETGLDAGSALAALLELEVAGEARGCAGGLFRRK